MILRLNKKYSDEKIKRIVEDLRNYAKGKLILLPNDIDIVKYNNYIVWSKDEFTKYILSRRVIQKKTIDDTWNKISKGYNFVIAKYKDDIKDYETSDVCPNCKTPLKQGAKFCSHCGTRLV